MPGFIAASSTGTGDGGGMVAWKPLERSAWPSNETGSRTGPGTQVTAGRSRQAGHGGWNWNWNWTRTEPSNGTIRVASLADQAPPGTRNIRFWPSMSSRSPR